MCLGVFGCVWVCLGVFGCVWVCLGVFGSSFASPIFSFCSDGVVTLTSGNSQSWKIGDSISSALI